MIEESPLRVGNAPVVSIFGLARPTALFDRLASRAWHGISGSPTVFQDDGVAAVVL